MNEPLIFNDVAQGIFKETISNAIFVDDKAMLPFQSRSKKAALRADHDRCIALYNDFKSKDCLLLISKFSKKGWKRDKSFNLNSKDLLILDWQLVGEEHEESLKILDQSVVKRSLHFCCIYTQASLEEVKNELHRFYLGTVPAKKIAEIRALIADTDLDNYWKTDKTEEDQIKLDELINNIVNAKPDDRDKEIKNFQDNYGLIDETITALTEIDKRSVISSFVKFRTAMRKEEEIFTSIKDDDLTYRLSYTDKNTLYINHTIIKLFQKNEVSGDQLYDSFLKSMIDEGNIFLTLMGLEMRNRFRENSAFVGKDFDNISEEAFFFHRVKNEEHLHIFEDFLREILKDQVASFLYEKDLRIFNALEDYKTNNNMSARVAKFEGDKDLLIAESFKLNKFYNLININTRKTNDNLRFGDVFKATILVPVKDPKTKEISKQPAVRYFVCITPLCDCLRPHKINNQFWFVEGREEESKDSVLKGTDGKFFSFLRSETGIIAIDWTNKSDVKPIAMNIPTPNVSKKIDTHYFDQKVQLELMDSLKENYAQRIANEAFGYPIRVGIDFVKKS